MFKFDMNRVLNGLEDLSTQEKIKALDKVYDQLEEVANEVSLTMAEIEEQYELVMLKKIDEAVNKYAEENNIQNAITVEDGVTECNYEDFGVRILPVIHFGEWQVSISLTRTIRLCHLEEIAKKINIHYNKNNDINIPVSEDELIPKILEILQKLLIK